MEASRSRKRPSPPASPSWPRSPRHRAWRSNWRASSISRWRDFCAGSDLSFTPGRSALRPTHNLPRHLHPPPTHPVRYETCAFSPGTGVGTHLKLSSSPFEPFRVKLTGLHRCRRDGPVQESAAVAANHRRDRLAVQSRGWSSAAAKPSSQTELLLLPNRQITKKSLRPLRGLRAYS